MTGMWLRSLLIPVVGAIALGGPACRKAQTPSRGATTDGAASPVVPPPAEPGTGPDKELLAGVEPDWSGLSDEEVAERSGITVEECGLALAEGDGIRISVCDFIREVNGLPPRYRARFDSLERRKELLEDMISLAVMELEARRLGLDRDPETQYYMERLLADKMEAQLKTEIRQRIRGAITPEDEAAYFESHRDQFNRPELASAAHIVVADEAEAQEIISQLTAPEADRNLFAKLAAERSVDAETRDRGGNLAYFTRPDVDSDRYRSIDPAIAAVVFQMENIGDVYPQPVRTAQGYHVLKLTGKRAAVVRTLEQVRPAVRVGIEEERFQEAWKQRLAELQQEVGVELHPENLADVQPRLPTPEEIERMHPGHGRPPPIAPPSPSSPASVPASRPVGPSTAPPPAPPAPAAPPPAP